MNPVPALLKTHKKLWISLGVGLFLIFVISQIPAVWGAYILSRSTGLALSGVTGTVWNGRASLASLPTPEREYSMGQLSWKLKPFSLLTLSPCAQVTTNLPGQQFAGEVCTSASGVMKLRNADISIPVALIQAKLPVLIQGQLSSHINEMELRGDVLLKLNGKLSWNGARVNTGANWLDIGSYAAEFTDNGNNGIRAKFFHLSGPVDVDLQVELLAPSGGSVSGELAAPRAFFESASAIDMLSMFAQEEAVDAEGKTHYRVDLSL
jgi:general secretion pathway protein N